MPEQVLQQSRLSEREEREEAERDFSIASATATAYAESKEGFVLFSRDGSSRPYNPTTDANEWMRRKHAGSGGTVNGTAVEKVVVSSGGLVRKYVNSQVNDEQGWVTISEQLKLESKKAFYPPTEDRLEIEGESALGRPFAMPPKFIKDVALSTGMTHITVPLELATGPVVYTEKGNVPLQDGQDRTTVEAWAARAIEKEEVTTLFREPVYISEAARVEPHEDVAEVELLELAPKVSTVEPDQETSAATPTGATWLTDELVLNYSGPDDLVRARRDAGITEVEEGILRDDEELALQILSGGPLEKDEEEDMYLEYPGGVPNRPVQIAMIAVQGIYAAACQAREKAKWNDAFTERRLRELARPALAAVRLMSLKEGDAQLIPYHTVLNQIKDEELSTDNPELRDLVRQRQVSLSKSQAQTAINVEAAIRDRLAYEDWLSQREKEKKAA